MALAGLLSSCDESRPVASDACVTASACGGPDANVVVPAGCDLAKSSKDAPSCVDDGVGVFVSPMGSDGAAGTKSAPVKSVAKGVELAGSKGLPRVYVCEGTYAESVALAKSVSIFGGFSCSGFAYSGTKPKIQPSEGAKVALDVTASSVVVADVHLLGPELGAPNSVAARVLNANGVVFERVKLEGRVGADGAKGTRTDFTGFPPQSALDGNNATAGGPGDAKEVTCPGGAKTTGGKGGANGFSGEPGLPTLTGGAGGALGQACAAGGGGGDGASGTTANAQGATQAGKLVDGIWTPGAGAQGPTGGPGQGGGGGQGAGGGNGGSGGAGGCGGAGGGGGTGGGASIALLSITSDVTLRASELITAKGGAGGAGGGGQAGQTIFGFGGTKTGGGCNGGNGGPGGSGGAGGGGAGGISVAIVHKGPKPTSSDTTITKGTAGTKGAGGAPGTNDGIDGVSADFFEVP